MAKQDISVRELVDLIKRNELRLPELQRRYVWTGERVRDLLDSLYRGYPSGAILVWETKDEEVPTRSLDVGSNPFDIILYISVVKKYFKTVIHYVLQLFLFYLHL
jgi:uncharacterized protein with ParB-like and HNH nuclease domain